MNFHSLILQCSIIALACSSVGNTMSSRVLGSSSQSITKTIRLTGGQALPANINARNVEAITNGAENIAMPTVLCSHGLSGNRITAIRYVNGLQPLLNHLDATSAARHVRLNASAADGLRNLLSLFPSFANAPLVRSVVDVIAPEPPVARREHCLFDIATHNIHSFDYPEVAIDLGLAGSVPNPLNLSLAQSDDIAVLRRQFDNITAERRILYGVSRGAAACLAMLGAHPQPHVDAMILECPFADSSQTTPLTNPTIRRLAESLLSNHRLDGPQPRDVVGNIHAETPILIVHSRTDNVIPFTQARELYLILRRAGLRHVYLLELYQGSHAQLLNDPEIAPVYHGVVHAFFKKYDLPHDQAAAATIPDLTHYQPVRILPNGNLDAADVEAFINIRPAMRELIDVDDDDDVVEVPQGALVLAAAPVAIIEEPEEGADDAALQAAGAAAAAPAEEPAEEVIQFVHAGQVHERDQDSEEDEDDADQPQHKRARHSHAADEDEN